MMHSKKVVRIVVAVLCMVPFGVSAQEPSRRTYTSTPFSERSFKIDVKLSLAELDLARRAPQRTNPIGAAEASHVTEPSRAIKKKPRPAASEANTDNLFSAIGFELKAPENEPPLLPRSSLQALPISAALAGEEKADADGKSETAETEKLKPGESWRIDLSKTIPHPNAGDFGCTPVEPESVYHDAGRESWVYDTKFDVPTQRPWVELGRPWYGPGITPRGIDLFGQNNLVRPKFYVYGDYRSGVQAGRNAGGRADNWAQRLNLDMDLAITDAGRFHSFVGPLDKQGRFTRWQLVDEELQYRSEFDLTPATAFYEGDLGEIIAGRRNQSSPFELPFTLGLIPLLFQNGIWMEDAVAGAAFAIPARHSRLLNWSNFDTTFFAVFDQLTSPAFADDSDAQAFGTALFIEAYEGYIETGYAYLNHRNQSDLSYHNATISFTRRYFQRISNSVRVIINAGQGVDKQARTADGGLLLVENSWITASPLTFVPYANFFYGWNRPQSVARAGGSGGILRNEGLNFDTDGLNGFPTLDASGADTAGMAIGVDLIGDNLEKQLILEFAALTPHGDRAIAKGNQYGLAARYQFPISHATLLRFDVMHGWRGNEENVYGTRMEYRWKF